LSLSFIGNASADDVGVSLLWWGGGVFDKETRRKALRYAVGAVISDRDYGY